jgi:uncharacterized protein (DUF488 family)
MKTHGLIHTIGYSNFKFNIFIDTLKLYGIKCLIDIRRHPSRAAAPYDQKNISRKLGNAYSWLQELAGPTTMASIGRPHGEGAQDPWVNQKLYDFGAWMGNDKTFIEGLKKLQKLSNNHQGKIAIMCSEHSCWSCHRSMVADAWVAMGGIATHIISTTKYVEHPTHEALSVRLNRYEPYTRKLWQSNQ